MLEDTPEMNTEADLICYYMQKDVLGIVSNFHIVLANEKGVDDKDV